MDKKKKDIGLTSQDRQALEGLGTQLLRGVSLATHDFLQAHALYRACYGSSSPALREEIVRSGMAEDLQYIDILKQKIEHVTIFHEAVAGGDELLCSSGSIFKLNAFQLKLADFDFVNMVQSIRSKLLAAAHLISSAGIESRDDNHFAHADEVSGILRKAGSHLITLASRYVSIATGDAVTIAVSSAYSMESERFVLQWFLNNQRGGYDELLIAYREARKHVSVELF